MKCRGLNHDERKNEWKDVIMNEYILLKLAIN